MLKTSIWEQYSKKIRERLDKPLYAGKFSAIEAKERGMRLVQGQAGWGITIVCFYWLVDESDGMIADAKFQAIGPTALIAAADACCEIVLRKNYDQVSRLTADLLDRHLRDRLDHSAFPDQCARSLNIVIEAIDVCVQNCFDIPFVESFDATPIDEGDGEVAIEIPGWEQMGDEQKLSIIEGVLDKEIRPYIALDAGGIRVLGLNDGREVRILYEGACASCPSSMGSTLSAIQRVLRSRVHPSLFVIPEWNG
ncbi:MAG: iron-sulfur cluster assembly protein nifU [Parachlamydiales bacterium]|nr:iron-sulfur cluster assembly protein nifU [Parachlamydiales bacterium]